MAVKKTNIHPRLYSHLKPEALSRISQERIYLDNAATSWPKPAVMADTLANYYRECGAPAGRGVYSEAIDVQRKIDKVRGQVAQLINAASANSVVFTFNGTDGLNLVINGILLPGDHVVTTVTEHNSVLRPLQMLRKHSGLQMEIVGCNEAGFVDPGDIAKAMTAKTRLLCINHASNVTGAIQPIKEMIELARERKIAVLVDAAQSLGHLSIDVQDLDCDFLAASGHKSLLGPLGMGVLYIKPGEEPTLTPTRTGGTGSRSDEDSQPTELPDRFESGNLDVGGIFALGAAIEFLQSEKAQALKTIQQQVFGRLLNGLHEIPGVRVFGPTNQTQCVCVASITVEQFDAREFATVLDSAASIQTRPGLHCAPLIHKAIGTFDRGGTVRLSPGLFNTAEQIETTLELIASLA